MKKALAWRGLKRILKHQPLKCQNTYCSQNATRQLVINKFKNKRRGDSSKEVTDRKRQRHGVCNYLPEDKEEDGCGDLRYKMRNGMLHGTELDEAMSKTFADRRVQVVSKKIAIPKLKKLYPALFQEMEIWAELARVRGGGSTAASELAKARGNLTRLLTKFDICETTDAALEHLAFEVREEDKIYSPPTLGGPMVLWDEALWVEGEKVTDLTFNKQDQFLTWGAGFTVFAQKPTRKATQCLAYVATVMLLKTDMLKPPKGFEYALKPPKGLQRILKHLDV
ncbi:uncharacterized protein LOC122387039 [Amphibalanus amphitrite]|uniref:uncharacterized protein LOC122387039 n=1 Tax=Amphibalanus amphitrite TaxID=1232801 RepID=UPI001C912088|nr:uncharacterized protein LOC122387039 [Amphibalanus amphitrite]